MSSIFEKMYPSLPVSLQNLAVSLVGWRYNKQRYSGNYTAYVEQLMRTQWFSAEQFRQMQIKELRTLIRDAIENVPYYQKTLGPFSGKIDSLTLDNLRELPIVEKKVLRYNVNEFTNHQRLKKYGYVHAHSSGTSGAPLFFSYDCDSIRHDLAFRERQYRWAGITGRERSARFSGTVLLGRHTGPPYWRHNVPENQWLFSTYHINQETAPLFYEALKRLNVAYLDGYPTALFEIARWVNKNGIREK